MEGAQSSFVCCDKAALRVPLLGIEAVTGPHMSNGYVRTSN